MRLFSLRTQLERKLCVNVSTIGKFAWSADGFSDHASDVNLKLEGPTHEPMLHAQLDDEEGGQHMDVVNLADCIKNENGRLRFMDCF